MVRRIAAGEFKAKCLRLLDEVQQSRQELVITKRGKPVARILPAEEPTRDIFGWMKGTIKITGDIISPIDEKWSVDE
jgi:prevent-host-death family protein